MLDEDFEPGTLTFTVMSGAMDGDVIMANEVVNLIDDDELTGNLNFNIFIDMSDSYTIGNISNTSVIIVDDERM